MADVTRQALILPTKEAVAVAAPIFTESHCVFVNGSLPPELLAGREDYIVTAADSAWVDTIVRLLKESGASRIRWGYEAIESVNAPHLAWIRRVISGNEYKAPAPQVQKPADPVDPPDAATKAQPEPAAAGLPAGSPDEPPHEPAGSDWGEFPPVEAYEADAALESRQHRVRVASELKTHAFQSEPGEWPEPADFWGTTPLPRFNLDWITPTIRPFVVNAAEMIGCDPGITYLQALTFAAGCLTDDIRVRVRKAQDWTEAARLWACVVGESGDGKSPSMRAITREANDLGRDIAERSKSKLAGYKLEMEVYDMDRKAWVTRKHKGEPAGPIPMPPAKPVSELLYFSSTTAEGLLEQQEQSTRGAMCNADEFLGWLMGMDQYKTAGKGSDRQFWLSSWDGAEFIGILVGKLRTIPNTGVTIIGGSQPHALREAATKMKLDTDGLLQRVLVYNSPGDAQENEEQPADREAILRWRSILHNLYAMKPHLEACQLSPKADAIRREANEWIAKVRGMQSIPDGARQALSKWRAYLPRIALTIHAIEAADKGLDVIPAQIEEHTVALAWEYMRDCLFPHTLRLYTILAEGAEDTRGMRAFGDYILSRDHLTLKPHLVNSTFKYYRRNLTTINLRREFWHNAESLGWVRKAGTHDRGTGISSDYAVNPAVFDGRFAEAAALAKQALAEGKAAAPAWMGPKRQPGED